MAGRTCHRIDCFPVALGLILSAGIILVFVIAVLRDDVSPYVPFISEAGAKPPESGLFSIFLDVCATLGCLTIILRYFIVDECNSSSSKSINVVNAISLLIGILSMIGMIVVAAYPMISIPAAHNFGALTLFSCSVLYGICHTWISYKMFPTFNSLGICRIRMVIMILSTLAFLTNVLFNGLGRVVWDSSSSSKWKGNKEPGDEGFDLLLVSSVAEWLMAFLFVMYFFTFAKEFKKVKVHLNVHLLVNHFDDVIVGGNSERSPLL